MFTLKIETGNAAFDGADETAAELRRILAATAEQIVRHYVGERIDGVLHDSNGNAVGGFTLSPNGTRTPALELIAEMRDLIEEAHDQHIFDRDDKHPDDCAYCAAVAKANTLLG